MSLPLCDAVAHLHCRGIIHRDLKPANVMVRTGGTPVVIDFGLAARFGATGELGLSREQLEPLHLTAGTPLYMAPEQQRGELVDGRADVFALGAILFEMLVGTPYRRVPELITTVAATRESEVPDPALDELRDRPLPEPLVTLVKAMLEPTRTGRFPHVQGVADELRRLVGAASSTSTSLPLQRAPLSGRDRELAELDRLLARAMAGRDSPRLAAIEGVSGIGKTRLLVELAGLAERRGYAVTVGSCRHMASTTTLAAAA